jgi:hypothetical protein
MARDEADIMYEEMAKQARESRCVSHPVLGWIDFNAAQEPEGDIYYQLGNGPKLSFRLREDKKGRFHVAFGVKGRGAMFWIEPDKQNAASPVEALASAFSKISGLFEASHPDVYAILEELKAGPEHERARVRKALEDEAADLERKLAQTRSKLDKLP